MTTSRISPVTHRYVYYIVFLVVATTSTMIFTTCQHHATCTGINAFIRHTYTHSDNRDLEHRTHVWRWAILWPVYRQLSTAASSTDLDLSQELAQVEKLIPRLRSHTIHISNGLHIIRPDAINLAMMLTTTFYISGLMIAFVLSYSFVYTVWRRIDPFITWDILPIRAERAIHIRAAHIYRTATLVTIPFALLLTWRCVAAGRMSQTEFAPTDLFLLPTDTVLFLVIFIGLEMLAALFALVASSRRIITGADRKDYLPCHKCRYPLATLARCPECGNLPCTRQRRALRPFLWCLVFTITWIIASIATAAGLTFWRTFDPLYSTEYNLRRTVELSFLIPPEESRLSPYAFDLTKVIELETNNWRAMIVVVPHDQILNVNSLEHTAYTSFTWAILRQSLDASPGNAEDWIVQTFPKTSLKDPQVVLKDFRVLSREEPPRKDPKLPDGFWFWITPAKIMTIPGYQIDRPYDIGIDRIRTLRQTDTGIWNSDLVANVRQELSKSTPASRE